MCSKMRRSEDNFMGFSPAFSWALEIRLWSSVLPGHAFCAELLVQGSNAKFKSVC